MKRSYKLTSRECLGWAGSTKWQLRHITLSDAYQEWISKYSHFTWQNDKGGGEYLWYQDQAEVGRLWIRKFPFHVRKMWISLHFKASSQGIVSQWPSLTEQWIRQWLMDCCEPSAGLSVPTISEHSRLSCCGSQPSRRPPMILASLHAHLCTDLSSRASRFDCVALE